MKLIDETKVKNEISKIEKVVNGKLSTAFEKGVEFAENEYQTILLNLIESIFNYEKESGSKIIEFDRTPQSVLEIYIKNKQYEITPT